MKKLSIRRRDFGVYEIGPAGRERGTAIVVNARDKREALKRGKARLRGEALARAAGRIC